MLYYELGENMKIKEVLEEQMKKLKQNNINDAGVKAKIILAFILDVKKEYLLMHDDIEIKEEDIQLYEKCIDEIIEGKPIQYITHQQEFMKINFYVDENVLIPQPDTEILVEETITTIKNINSKKILDLCTGSGAIAISLAKYTKANEIYASDISKKALKVAIKNATDNDVIGRVKFIESDLFKKLLGFTFDIIVSNPPYIKRNTIKKLDKEVQNEPHIALDGGEDGLIFYKEIIENAYNYLANNGKLMLEIGYDQKNEVIQILEKQNRYKDIYSKKDLCGNDRIIVATKK